MIIMYRVLHSTLKYNYTTNSKVYIIHSFINIYTHHDVTLFSIQFY